ncbi:MAG: leucyl/phenylalanyl-tRNA--protein transferase [Desulfopila sp.]|jgi:leucyl/phenylalanyl-tRNA--protein transferase|nr:leucyl/phenylalanyl-tRNA--protein transferase [Desulfopila sp.]
MPVFRLTDSIVFPRPDLAEPEGLLAIGGDLSPARLVSAYRLGIFPWYSQGDPILWWYTSPRLVIYPKNFRVPKRLARYMKKSVYTITMDEAFDQVIESCASIRTVRGEGTWITAEMIDAYRTLHRMGYAHSVEYWQNGTLAGGLYGVALDRVFFGESMFSKVSNASKTALVVLVSYLEKHDYQLIDCQMTTEHLLQFGACEVTGESFTRQLREFILTITPREKWKYDSSNEITRRNV